MTMVGERIPDREPIWRKFEDQLEGPASRIRNRPGKMLKKRMPKFENRNFGGGLAVGTLEAGVAMILKETLGVPFGSDTEVVDAVAENGATIYTVNVDAPANNMAEVRAFLESGTGFSSLLTDTIDIQSSEVIKTRIARDTYQIKIKVVD